MSDAVPRGRKQKRGALLNDADEIVVVLRASGANSEELGILSPDAVTALGTLSMFNLKHCTEIGGSEADPVTEMMALEALAYQDFTGARCTMVGIAAIASPGSFLPQSGLENVLTETNVPAVATSVFRPGGDRMPSAVGCASSASLAFAR